MQAHKSKLCPHPHISSSLTWGIHNDRMPWRGWTQEEAYIALKSVCRATFVIMLKDNMGFPGSSAGKESTCDAGDPSLIPRARRPNREGIGYLLQYSCLENPHGQRSLKGYSPRGHKESDTTEQLSTAQHKEYIVKYPVDKLCFP